MADGSPRTAVQFVQRVHDRLAQAFADLGSTMPQGALGFAAQLGTSATGASSGRNVGLARASVSPPERLMVASLVDAFTRMDRGETSVAAHAKRGRMLPFGLVSALQTAGGQDSPTASAAATPGG
jgi:hypothetical protein